jgi:hypothetical protein
VLYCPALTMDKTAAAAAGVGAPDPVRVAVAALPPAFNVWTGFIVSTGKRGVRPERHALGSHACSSFKRSKA